MNAPRDLLRFGSGHTVRRLEDPALVAGRGQFTDDLSRPGQLHLVFQRSPHAHARILSIDTAGALAVDGVLAVYTGADLIAAGVKPMAGPPPVFKRPDGSATASTTRFALANETVRFVGEAVVAVVATSREAATNGAEAVLVDYDMLPAVTTAQAAMAAGAPALCPAAPDNVVAESRYGDVAATEAAFARAAHTVKLDLVNQRLAPSAMEPRVVLAEMEQGSAKLLVFATASSPPCPT
jgi:carbon-monoxide dehydrogenase large subunit